MTLSYEFIFVSLIISICGYFIVRKIYDYKEKIGEKTAKYRYETEKEKMTAECFIWMKKDILSGSKKGNGSEN